MSEVVVGSIWRNHTNGMLAKVVNILPDVATHKLIAEVVYDSGDGTGFRPSILPSTWRVDHWSELFSPLPDTDKESQQ